MIRNERGNTLILALAFLGISGVVFLSGEIMQRAMLQRTTAYKIRRQMTVIEQQIRQALHQPQAFVGCQSSETQVTGCAVNPDIRSAYQTIKGVGLPCTFANTSADAAAPATTCDFKADGWTLDLATKKIQVNLSFGGAGMVKDTEIIVDVPAEILQSQILSCPAISSSRPVFRGLSSSGQVLCGSIPRCGAGQYMIGSNRNTMATLCVPFPADTASCSSSEVIQSFSWQGSSVSYSCSGRADPFTYFGGSL